MSLGTLLQIYKNVLNLNRDCLNQKITELVENKIDESRPFSCMTFFVLNNNNNEQNVILLESKSGNSELIQNETNADGNQEKDCIDVTSTQMNKLENLILNSNGIDQKVTSVEPKFSTDEDVCTVDSNKPFSE